MILIILINIFIQKIAEDFENNHFWMAHTRGKLLILRQILLKVWEIIAKRYLLKMYS